MLQEWFSGRIAGIIYVVETYYMLLAASVMKTAVGIILGCALGFTAHFLLSKQLATGEHWKAVHKYNEFVSNPSNYEPDATTGLTVTTPPRDILSNLAALVAAGELSYVDLVFPTVPYSREASRHGMALAQKHPEIVYITGNPSYVALKTSGEQPLHLNIWFEDSDQSVIQTLISELEEMPREGGR